MGLSSITKLAPRRLVGQMMGTWFMGTALGNLIAGLAAGGFSDLPIVALFGSVAKWTGGAGLLLLLASPFLTRLIPDENPTAAEPPLVPLPETGEPGGRVTVLSKKWLLPDQDKK